MKPEAYLGGLVDEFNNSNKIIFGRTNCFALCVEMKLELCRLYILNMVSQYCELLCQMTLLGSQTTVALPNVVHNLSKLQLRWLSGKTAF